MYTNAFFIYALAEYIRATGDKQALAEAKRSLTFLKNMQLIRNFNGYFGGFSVAMDVCAKG